MKTKDAFQDYLTEHPREFLALRLEGIGFSAAMEKMREKWERETPTDKEKDGK